jgi:hypothetical protein
MLLTTDFSKERNMLTEPSLGSVNKRSEPRPPTQTLISICLCFAVDQRRAMIREWLARLAPIVIPSRRQ